MNIKPIVLYFGNVAIVFMHFAMSDKGKLGNSCIFGWFDKVIYFLFQLAFFTLSTVLSLSLYDKVSQASQNSRDFSLPSFNLKCSWHGWLYK